MLWETAIACPLTFVMGGGGGGERDGGRHLCEGIIISRLHTDTRITCRYVVPETELWLVIQVHGIFVLLLFSGGTLMLSAFPCQSCLWSSSIFSRGQHCGDPEPPPDGRRACSTSTTRYPLALPTTPGGRRLPYSADDATDFRGAGEARRVLSGGLQQTTLCSQ